MDGRVALRDLHDLRVRVIRVTANESRLACQRQLHGALAQGQLGLSALSDISRQALDAREPAPGIELASRRLFQPDLTPVATAKTESQGVCRVAGAELAHLRFEDLAIVGMDLTEEFVARTSRSSLVISENASRIVAPPRLTRDGIPFESHDLAGHQCIRQAGLMLLEHGFRYLALGDVDIRTDEARCRSIVVIGYEVARIDPSNLAIGTDKAIFAIVFAPPRGDSLLEASLYGR